LAPPQITFLVDIDPRLIADLDAAEQCVLAAYQDSLGIWTIAWGHELFPQTNNWSGTVWTQAQADAQRATDIEAATTFAQGFRGRLPGNGSRPVRRDPRALREAAHSTPTAADA